MIFKTLTYFSKKSLRAAGLAHFASLLLYQGNMNACLNCQSQTIFGKLRFLACFHKFWPTVIKLKSGKNSRKKVGSVRPGESPILGRVLGKRGAECLQEGLEGETHLV